MERLDDSNEQYVSWRWLEQQGEADSDPIPDEVDSNGWREWLVAAMRGLSARERELLAVKYGVYGDKCRLADMAHKYGITPARASQIVQEGIKKVRRYLVA